MRISDWSSDVCSSDLLMQHGGNELNLLLHAFGEFLDFLFPPAFHFHFPEPAPNPFSRFVSAYTFEAGQVEDMFAYFHFFVESSFFRKVANHGNVRWLKSFAIQEYFAFIRSCDLINDPDQGGLACAVGPKQSENTAFFHLRSEEHTSE